MDWEPLESDWKVLRKRVPEWRERYLESINQSIAGILLDESMAPTERFWNGKERVDEGTELLLDLLDGHSESKMSWYLSLMHGHGFIGDDDLYEFGHELRDRIRRATDALQA